MVGGQKQWNTLECTYVFYFGFSRGNKGFIVINAQKGYLNADINTGLVEGSYCDIISGNYENGRCTGTIVKVGSDGHAHFNIDGNLDDPVLAIHIGKHSKFQRNQNGLNNPKRNNNIIWTMVKYGDTFYGRHTAARKTNKNLKVPLNDICK